MFIQIGKRLLNTADISCIRPDGKGKTIITHLNGDEFWSTADFEKVKKALAWGNWVIEVERTLK